MKSQRTEQTQMIYVEIKNIKNRPHTHTQKKKKKKKRKTNNKKLTSLDSNLFVKSKIA